MTDDSLKEGIRIQREINILEDVAKHLEYGDITSMSFFSDEHHNHNLIFSWYDDKEIQNRITDKVLKAIKDEIDLLRNKFSEL